MDDVAVGFNAVCALLCLAWALRAFVRGPERPTQLRTQMPLGPSLVAVALFAVAFAMTAIGSSGRPAWGLPAVFVALAGGLVFAVAKVRGGHSQH